MKKIFIYIIIILATNYSISAQSEEESILGTVSYLTSNNVYVRFIR